MYRRWSPQLKTSALGGAFHPKTDEATAWLEWCGNPTWDNEEKDSARGGVMPPYQPFRVVDVSLENVAKALS